MFTKMMAGYIVYQEGPGGGGEHHEPPPEQHHEEQHHEPPPEQHHEEPPATPDPTGALAGSEYIAPSGGDAQVPPPEGHEAGAGGGGDTHWASGGPPADASPEEIAQWNKDSEASRTEGSPWPEGGGYGDDQGALEGGAYGKMGGEYGAMGGEYGAFDATVPPPATELGDAPAGVQELFSQAAAGDITYAEAYEQAEEDFEWTSEAHDAVGEYGEYGGGEYGAEDDGAVPAPTFAPDDEEDEDEDWEEDHDQDLEDEDEDEDEDEEDPAATAALG